MITARVWISKYGRNRIMLFWGKCNVMLYLLVMIRGWLILTLMLMLSLHWSLKDRGRYVFITAGYYCIILPIHMNAHVRHFNWYFAGKPVLTSCLLIFIIQLFRSCVYSWVSRLTSVVCWVCYIAVLTWCMHFIALMLSVGHSGCKQYCQNSIPGG